jgi:hypothetical protein
MLKVELSMVNAWESGSELPDKDQLNWIKKINSPWRRILRYGASNITPILQKAFLFISKYSTYPTTQDRGLMTHYTTSFRQTRDFKKAYAKGIELLKSDPKSYNRIHQSTWAASIALKNEGDWVELGTGKGFTMSATLNYHKEKWNDNSKNLWLVDTFSPFAIDSTTGVQGKSGEIHEHYCDDIDKLKEHFKEFNNVHFLQGLVPDCLESLKVEKISFLHIDLNSAKPEIAGLSFLWDRLVKGAVLLLDDYGFPNRIDQHIAMNDFASRHSFNILQLPTGQGLAIK